MASSAANRVPDELVSEILTPLLKHSDEEFLDRSKKPLLDPGFTSWTYLLVSKAWLRVSTPLLYNVVILRTTPQAEALQAALKSSNELGLFIKKLRVEGGFGNAMHTILRCAPNITDVSLTLHIGGLDNVRGLCDGLPLVNPRRVIVVDANEDDGEQRPKKNKKITELVEILISVIPKWDNLKTFHFPYKTGFESAADSITGPRAKSLASALAKSQSLETLIVTIGDSFPSYLRQMVHVPSLKSLHFVPPKSRLGQAGVAWGLRRIHAVADQDRQLKALITYNLEDHTESCPLQGDNQCIDLDADDDDDGLGWILHGGRVNMRLNQHGYYFSPENSYACAESLSALKKIGETIGSTVENLLVSLGNRHANDKIDPALLAPFTSLTYLAWSMQGPFFLTPRPGYSALPQLEELRAGDETPALLELVEKLPLDCLRRALISGHVPAAVAFLQSHGTKLQHLGSTIEILIKFDVFDVCTNLNTLIVDHSSYRSPLKFQVLPADFFSRSAPHVSLAKIHFESRALVRSHTVVGGRKEAAAARAILEQLDPESFPVLKEIQIDDIKWPTSEQEARKDYWIPLSEALHHKGIKVVDASGVGGPTGARAKGTKH
ncbi:hypothetical protein B0H19DRAFT_1134906 [Mycena capillaripes]|nr:hypothetical protein B0H19DRAFT_1134906 [Mycena capillaripes]